MIELARHENAFVRPSPSRGSLGGVGSRTREAITLCETAGFNVVLVETVGIGQSEIDVARVTDFVVLLVLTGAGDELQSIKKGISEHADALVVSKADGTNASRAEVAVNEFRAILGRWRKRLSGWDPRILAVSAQTGRGLEELWSLVIEYRDLTMASGYWLENRRNQMVYGLRAALLTELHQRIWTNDVVARELAEAERQVREGAVSPRSAASRVLSTSLPPEPIGSDVTKGD